MTLKEFLKKYPFGVSKVIKGGYDPDVKSKYSLSSPLKRYFVTNAYLQERKSGSRHYDRQTKQWKKGASKKGTYNHGGYDFSCPTGTPVFAATSGKVGYAGWEDKKNYKKGFGTYLRIHSSNGHKVYYGHLSKLLVNVNGNVYTGERIGLTGNTGRSTGPHLHFEVRTVRNQPIAVHFKLI